MTSSTNQQDPLVEAIARRVAEIVETALVDAVVAALAQRGQESEPTLLRSGAACKRWSISKATLSRLVAAGLPVVRVMEENRYPVAAGEKWLAERGAS